MQSAKEKNLTKRETVAVRDSTRMAGILKARNLAEAVRDSVYMQVAIIKSIDDSRYTWPHLLEEVNLALPPYTWLTEVNQTSPIFTAAGNTDSTGTKDGAAAKADEKGDKPKVASAAADHRAKAEKKRQHADSLFTGAGRSTKFRISGQTVDIQALTLFMKNLEGSPFIKNVQLTRSDLVAGERDVTQFELEAESEMPPASMLQRVPLSVAVR
jgi:hypothetical protein